MLAGKLALVTGAGSGIGRATCQILAREGANVVASDLSSENARKTIECLAGSNHHSTQIDVTSSNTISKVISEVKGKYQTPPNILVNCAGITRDNWFLKLTEDDFQTVFDVNLKGTFLITQQVCKELVESKKSGSIINIGSIIGQIGNMGQSNYAATKAGVEAFTKSIAMEMAAFHIRCNAILPGFIETPMTETVPDKVKNQFKMLIPLKRFGSPEEIGEVVAFLASDRSSYITGTLVKVTGGLAT